MIFSFFDTETTGLPFHQDAPLRQQPRIIEFAGILVDAKGDELSRLEFICNPGIAIEEIITKITGLTNDDLNDKPSFEHFVPELQNHFNQADASVAHNHSFDRNLLVFDLRRIKKVLADISFPQLNICTVEQTYHQYGRRMKLQELIAEFVGEYVQKHRASDDVEQMIAVCKKIGFFDAFQEVAA